VVGDPAVDGVVVVAGPLMVLTDVGDKVVVESAEEPQEATRSTTGIRMAA
jgi:hypothetical protein